MSYFCLTLYMRKFSHNQCDKCSYRWLGGHCPSLCVLVRKGAHFNALWSGVHVITFTPKSGQTSSCKMLQHYKYHVKVLQKWLHMNGHTVMFPPYSKVITTVQYQKRRFSNPSTLVHQKWRPLKTAFYRISVNGKTKVLGT